MAEDKGEPREVNWRQLLPWTALFRGFGVAMSLNKLLLAAAGILVMMLGWWFLALVFYNIFQKPQWGDYTNRPYTPPAGLNAEEAEKWRGDQRWKQFRFDRDWWNLMHEAAGPFDSTERFEAADLAESPEELERINKAVADADKPKDEKKPDDKKPDDKKPDPKLEEKIPEALSSELEHMAHRRRLSQTVLADERWNSNRTQLKAWIAKRGILKPAGTLRTWPWFEDRGPNPFLMVTGQIGKPWETGHFWDWLLTEQVPVLVEPLVKFLRPVVYFFNPHASWVSRLYFTLVMLWTLATWALFGGMITRMAAVEVARNEKIGIREAFFFVARRYLSYATAPLLPLALVAVLVLAMILFGLLHLIPVFGDIVIDGLLWGVMLALGLVMAGVLVGLITWPLMTATISAEDEESLNAVARAYSYVVQAPWHYIWYTLVALAYGAVVVFFVNFMGSMAVYLAEWGVGQTPGIHLAGREPDYLFVYAPTSYHWRELLLQGATVEGQPVVEQGQINPAAYKRYLWGAWENPPPRDSMAIWNHIGAGLVALWLGAFFLLILGFGYSYFWSATTIIYLLMRKQVDDAELDEVYFEEDEQEDYFAAPSAAPKPAPAPPPPPPSPGLTMVEPPALRTPPPPPAPAPAATPAAPPTATPAAPPAPARTEALPDDGNGNPPA